MSLSRRLRKATRPVADLVVIHAEAGGEMLLRQNAFLGEAIEHSVEQVKRLAESESLQEAVESQRRHLRTLGRRAAEVAQENLHTLGDAGRDASETVLRALFGDEAEDEAEGGPRTPTASSPEAPGPPEPGNVPPQPEAELPGEPPPA